MVIRIQAMKQDDLRCRWFWVRWVSAPGAWRESRVFRMCILTPSASCFAWFCLTLILFGGHPPNVLLLMALVPSAVSPSPSSYPGAPFFPLTPAGLSPGRAVLSWLCSLFLCYPPQSFWVLFKALWRKVF